MKLTKTRWLYLGLVAFQMIFLLQGPVPAQAGTIAPIQSPERWRSGFNLQGPFQFDATIGQASSPIGQFHSNPGLNDSYFAFSARGYAKTIDSAQIYLLSRSGSTESQVSLTLEVIRIDGSSSRTLSFQPVDLQVSPTGQWIPLPLQSDTHISKIQPGEVLAFHFHWDGSLGGNMSVPVLVEVSVQQDRSLIYLPIITR